MALVRRNLNLRLPSALPARNILLPSTPTTSAVDSDFEKLHVIGHGNGGTVYKVRHRLTSFVYALKVLNCNGDPLSRRQALREIQILRRTDSPNIVRFHGTYEDPSGTISILMEYMDKGTLLSSTPTFDEPMLCHVARQILNGLCYLHSHNIIHRDIKPSNILVNSGLEVKISDFGVSKITCRSLDPCDSYVGTCAYMSPERFDPGTYGSSYDGYASDIWSLGLTLLELYVGHFPFLSPGQRPDWAALMIAICFGDRPSLPEGCSGEFRDFIECCLQKDSKKRWTAKELLSHSFVCTGSDSGSV